MDGEVFVLVLVAAIVCVAIVGVVNHARQRSKGDLPRTRFGVPISARILFILGGGIPFAAAMQAPRMNFETDVAIGVTVIFGLIGMMLGGAGALIMRYHRKRQQTIRDRRALFILKKLETGETLDFSLYLRAFATTGKLPQAANHHPYEARYRPVFDDMEEALAKAMEPSAPMVALGLPGEHIGGGRIETTEESWRESFERLASSAKVLLLLPSARPGTLHEIGWIDERGLWPKTVLFMPQQASGWEWKTEELATQWSATQRELAEAGFIIPDYRKCGMLFRMDASRQITLYRPQGRNKIEDILPEFVEGGGLKRDERELIACPECGYCERWDESSMISNCHFCRTSVFDQITEIEQRRKQVPYGQ
jgi:hypothetical protein